MRLLLALLVGVCLLLAQLPAHAEGSLLPNGEYPEADCRSPLRPLAGDRHSEWMHYRNEMLRYRACVEAYVRTAREDMQRIQRQVDRAVRDYNREAGMP